MKKIIFINLFLMFSIVLPLKNYCQVMRQNDSLRLYFPLAKVEDNDFASNNIKSNDELTYFISYGLDNCVELYNANSMSLVKRFFVKKKESYNDILFADFTYDSQFILAENQHYFVLFSILDDSSIYVYDIENKKVELNTLGSDIFVNLALGSDSNDITIRKNKKIIYKKNEHSLPKLKSTKKDREVVDASPKGNWLFEISKNGKVFLSSQSNSKSFLLKKTQEEFTDPMIGLVYDFDKNENHFIYIGNDGNLYKINLLSDKIDQCNSVNAASIIYDNNKNILYYFNKDNYVNNSLVKFDLNNCTPHKSIKSSTLLVQPIGYNDTTKSIFFLDKENQFSNYFSLNMKTLAFSLEKHDARYKKNEQMDYEDWDDQINNSVKVKYAGYYQSNSGNFRVVNFSSGEVKISDTNNHDICNVYFFKNNNYIVTLPNSPYYMCSKDASKMLHYVTPSLKVIGFDQLDPIYNRPDIVLDSIGKYFAGGPDFKLIKQYREAWVKRMNRLDLDTASIAGNIEVPDAEIVHADQIEYNNTSGSLNFHFKASDAKHKLRRYNVYVNEVPLYGSNGISITEKVHLLEKDISLKLSAGDNKIQVSVMNDLGLESFRYPVYVQYQPAKPVVSNTYYIGIGVDSFATSKFNLQYCVKDVNDLGSLLARKKNTKTIILKNKGVTKENVLKLKSFLQQTTEQDKVIISCSSHGLLDKNNNFYLAMHDVDFNKPEEKGLAYEDLQGLLDGIPARKKLLLLDACNSGENEKAENKVISMSKELAIKEGSKGLEVESVSDSSKNSFETMMELFVNVNNQTGATVISAAGGKQSAYEAVLINGKPISNGAFTYSIIEYLMQHENEKDKLTVNQLKQYTEQRVIEITNGKQKPTSRQETMEVDWGL